MKDRTKELSWGLGENHPAPALLSGNEGIGSLKNVVFEYSVDLVKSEY